MAEREDGGPAFPQRVERQRGPFETEVTIYFGMSLRDWFAGQALAGLLASEEPDFQMPSKAKLADTAYGYADAMLAARKEGGEG
jgi:hypothetical protein